MRYKVIFNRNDDSFVISERVRKFRFSNRLTREYVGLIIRKRVSLNIRNVVFDIINEKVSELRDFWDFDFLVDELIKIDRLLVTSRVLEEL